MNRFLLFGSVALVLALAVWLGARAVRPAPPPDGAEAEDRTPRPPTPRPVVLEPVDEEPETERTKAPETAPPRGTDGPDLREASAEETAAWTTRYAGQGRAALASALQSIARDADEERERLWADARLAQNPTIVQADPDATLFQVERQYPGPRSVTVGRAVASHSGDGSASFEVALVPAESATALASLQRQAAWLEARIASLPQ